jgi:hypothetical protein
MTIALGFRCIDGCVLAADSEWTYGGSLRKSEGSKIGGVVYPDGSIFVHTGAGEWDMMRAFFEDSQEDLRKLNTAEKTLPRLKAVFENRLKQLYRAHIYPMPRNQQAESGARFLIAFKTPTGEIGLWTTNRTILVQVSMSEPECIGIGADFGGYLIETFHTMNMLAGDAAILAAIIIREAGSRVQCVGDPGMVMRLFADSRPLDRMKPDVMERYAKDFRELLEQVLRPVLFACFNPDSPSWELDDAIADFTKRIKDLRVKLFPSP